MPSTKTTDRQSDTPTEALITKLRASAALCWPDDIKRQSEWVDKQLEIAMGGDADRNEPKTTPAAPISPQTAPTDPSPHRPS